MKRKNIDPQKTAQGRNRYDEDEYLDEKVSISTNPNKMDHHKVKID
jgi:hypothetical protein